MNPVVSFFSVKIAGYQMGFLTDFLFAYGAAAPYLIDTNRIAMRATVNIT